MNIHTSQQEGKTPKGFGENEGNFLEGKEKKGIAQQCSNKAMHIPHNIIHYIMIHFRSMKTQEWVDYGAHHGRRASFPSNCCFNHSCVLLLLKIDL
jgi:hypothetical protein